LPIKNVNFYNVEVDIMVYICILKVLLMARLYEYQGKELLKKEGISIANGELVTTPAEARKAADKIGKPVVVKSQIWATGRFKAGAIKFADTPDEAEKAAKELIGKEIKGYTIQMLWIEEKLPIDKEFYAGVIINDSYKVKSPTMMFSTSGGVDFEQAALKTPEKVAKATVDIFEGFSEADAKKLVGSTDAPKELVDELAKATAVVYKLFRDYDCRSMEINPLVSTKDGKIFAADCRMVIDDASVFRHEELGIDIPRESSRPFTDLEKIAWSVEEGDYRGTSYFAEWTAPSDVKKGDLYIGFHGMGGGGSMLGADALIRHGFTIANYADTSGNPTATKVYRIAKIILAQPGIDGYIVMDPNISSQEMWHSARGMVKAIIEDLSDKKGFPVIILLAGNKEDETFEILEEELADLVKSGAINLELYGREHIYQVDFVAKRMKEMVEEYRKKEGK